MTPSIGGLLKKLGFRAVTLEQLFERYIAYKSISVEPSTAEGYRSRFLHHIPPNIRRKKARDVTRRELINILTEMERQGMHNQPKRLFYDIRAMLQYAVLIEELERNVFAGIFAKDIFRNQISEHFPAITDYTELSKLLRDIDSYTGAYRIKTATRILPYLFVRSHNLRSMEWAELDLDTAIWTIPASKMKMKAPFVLPLPRQALALLRDMQHYQSKQDYTTPYVFGNSRGYPSSNTIIRVLRSLGYPSSRIVPHGFRTTFSTIAYEHQRDHGFSSEVIEACLAHKEPNAVKEAYNRAEYREPMRELFQWYADFLDDLD